MSYTFSALTKLGSFEGLTIKNFIQMSDCTKYTIMPSEHGKILEWCDPQTCYHILFDNADVFVKILKEEWKEVNVVIKKSI